MFQPYSAVLQAKDQLIAQQKTALEVADTQTKDLQAKLNGQYLLIDAQDAITEKQAKELSTLKKRVGLVGKVGILLTSKHNLLHTCSDCTRCPRLSYTV